MSFLQGKQQLKKWVQPFRLVIYFVSILLGIATLATFLERWSLIAELAVHFRPQYAVAGVVLAAGAWALSKHKLMLFCCGIGLWHVFALLYAGFAFTAPPVNALKTEYRILQFNANVRNRNIDALALLLEQAQRHDMLVVQELPEGLGLLHSQQLRELYPYQYAGKEGKVFFEGLAVFSKLPITVTPMQHEGASRYAGVLRIHVPDKNVTVYGVHSPTPIPLNAAQERKAQHQWLFDLLAKERQAAIAIGDFNVTPYAYQFQQLLREHRLYLAAFPDSLLHTWPRVLPITLLQIPIDLAVVNNRANILNRTRLSIPGSDHYAVSNTVLIP